MTKFNLGKIASEHFVKDEIGLLIATEEDIENFADQILEEVAQEIAKLPFGDTASSFAVFVRQMKVNRSDNESGRSPLSATSTSAE